MSHPLGALAQNMTHFVRYGIGQDALASGVRLAKENRWDEAARLFEVSARVAGIFAKAGVCIEPECAAYWWRVYDERRKLCMEAAGKCTGACAG